ncbi:hypothetical protein ACIQC9_03440 [Brevundimonas sp. NPDC092305]|uniref:hypothetical protein n=1 Tax=Brevundimonas sp. NPDC092305 TaxID=3363957 RepID=UPI003809D870
MTQALLFTALIPLALLGVLALVVASGRISPKVRAGIERVMAILLYGTLMRTMGVRAGDYAKDADWFMVAVLVAAAGCFGVNAVLALRRGRLFQSRAAS